MTTPAIPTLDLRTPAIAIPLLGLGTWQSDGDGRGAEIERRDRGGGHGSSLRDLRPRRPVVPGATLEDIAVRNGRTGGGHMRILVAVASRHGSTREIGDAVAEVLRDSGFGVDVADPDDIESVDPYQAVLLGSSVYVGRWAASARALVDRCSCGLTRRPVWLFS